MEKVSNSVICVAAGNLIYFINVNLKKIFKIINGHTE